MITIDTAAMIIGYSAILSILGILSAVTGCIIGRGLRSIIFKDKTTKDSDPDVNKIYIMITADYTQRGEAEFIMKGTVGQCIGITNGVRRYVLQRYWPEMGQPIGVRGLPVGMFPVYDDDVLEACMRYKYIDKDEYNRRIAYVLPIHNS